jgi:hypothetical protein
MHKIKKDNGRDNTTWGLITHYQDKSNWKINQIKKMKLSLNKKLQFTILTTFFIFAIILFGCQKEKGIIGIEEDPEIIMNKIKGDENLENYINSIKSLQKRNILTSNIASEFNVEIENQTANKSKELSQEEFQNLFIESNKNNIVAKEKIATLFEFKNSEEFLNNRAIMINSLSNLSKKYNLNKLNVGNWYSLISNNIENKNNSSSISKQAVANCLEQYQHCMDDALAVFAVEQVACVSAGALGWTLIGAAVFVACEGASHYHLYTSRRKCGSSYTGCH